MTSRELEEYRALRTTIERRGTARIWVVLVGLSVWAGLTVASAALAELPVATLLPLLILAAAFETVISLYTGIERIGRYVQVFLEDPMSDPGWEHRIMAYGKMFPGWGVDPLFTPFFAVAAIFNFVPVFVAGPLPIEYWVVGSVHALFLLRLLLARRSAARQRAIDLDRFTQLKNNPPR
jgi:hypothetical protein